MPRPRRGRRRPRSGRRSRRARRPRPARPKEHEWVERRGDGRVRVGITDFAQKQLGDIVF
ncbi:hypothetical protein ACWDNT_33900, partial [Streptomyces sp. NPDC000963]